MRPLSSARGACHDTDEQSEHGHPTLPQNTPLSKKIREKFHQKKFQNNKTGKGDRRGRSYPTSFWLRDLPPPGAGIVTLTSIKVYEADAN